MNLKNLMHYLQKNGIMVLARSFYAKKDMLVFDEPTASLDPLIEEEIFRKIMTLDDRMVVLISHRLSCAKLADQVIVLKDGRIVEVGDHEALVAKQGYYYTLFQQQAKRYSAVE